MLVYFRSGYERLLHRLPGRAMEWIASLMLSTCGWVLLVHQEPPLFERAYFATMHHMAPQWAWGYGAMLTGLLRIGFLTINGTMPRTSSHLRVAGSFLALFFWFSVSYGMAQNSFVSLGMAVFPWLFIADLYSLHRASTDMRLADNMGQEKRGQRESQGAGTFA